MEDHGIGISPDDQQRLFERFARVVSPEHYGGFGLGLWIVKLLVEAMGGKVAVRSAVGQGSVFSAELPRQGSVTARRCRRLPRVVLVVDDDASIREALADLLGDEGYRVTTATNGAEALDLLAARRPSCARA